MGAKHVPNANRICIFSPYSGRDNFSGIQVRLRMLAKSLRDLGFDLHVIGPYAEVEGATVHYFSLDVPLWRRLFRSFTASRIIRRLDPSVVILEGPAIVGGLRGATVVQMIHDSKFATEHRRRGGWLLWLYYFVMCRVYAYTMTVSKSEQSRIAESLRLTTDRILISYNGVSDPWLSAPAENRKDYDLIYVSNFAPHKGHARLLNILTGTQYRVAFVGGDLGTLSQVKRHVSETGLNVNFFHNLSEADLIDLYDRSKVFVFPSYLEGFGIPFLEARARGLPVVASDLEVFRELATDIGGRIVNFDDAAVVRSAIEESLEQDPQKIDLKKFSWRYQAEILVSEIPALPKRHRA